MTDCGRRRSARKNDGRQSNKKKPNPIDIHVGSRIRLRRNMLGMSQEKLGESLGHHLPADPEIRKGHQPCRRQPTAGHRQRSWACRSRSSSKTCRRSSRPRPAGFAEDASTDFVRRFLHQRRRAAAEPGLREDLRRRRCAASIIDLVKTLAARRRRLTVGGRRYAGPRAGRIPLAAGNRQTARLDDPGLSLG